MANGLNKAMLIGYLGGDPELRSTQTGKNVLRFSVATSETWTDNGEKKEQTFWHRVVLWGNRAEPLSKFLHKGSRVYVEGRIETRSYEADGVKKFSVDINAREVILLDGKRDDQQQGESRQQSREQSSRGGGQQQQQQGGGGKSAAQQDASGPPDFGGFGGADDDIPFLCCEIAGDIARPLMLGDDRTV